MKIFGLDIRKRVKFNAEEGLASLGQALSELSRRMYELEKQNNRIERQVYRKNGSRPDQLDQEEADQGGPQPAQNPSYGPGDEVPPGFIQ